MNDFNDIIFMRDLMQLKSFVSLLSRINHDTN